MLFAKAALSSKCNKDLFLLSDLDASIKANSDIFTRTLQSDQTDYWLKQSGVVCRWGGALT